MIEQLTQLIESSNKILITSHISPDGDSVSSSLLLYQILKLNFPDKNIRVAMEEKPYGLSFLGAYEDIEFKPLPEILKSTSPDLVIILDANALSRVSRDALTVQQYLSENTVKLAVIDHHDGIAIDNVDAFINNSSPAVTLDVYNIFIENLGYEKPDGYAQTALTGIYTDTGGFVHRSLNYEQVFDVVPKLIADGADIELIVSNLNKISPKGIEILKELLVNTVLAAGYTYTFISDESSVLANHEALIQATETFRSHFLRNVEGRPWGFIVYRDVMAAELTYSVSFRAKSGLKDISLFAARLGGGGHKPAAGAKFAAANVKEALGKVLAAIAAVEAS